MRCSPPMVFVSANIPGGGTGASLPGCERHPLWHSRGAHMEIGEEDSAAQPPERPANGLGGRRWRQYPIQHQAGIRHPSPEIVPRTTRSSPPVRLPPQDGTQPVARLAPLSLSRTRSHVKGSTAPSSSSRRRRDASCCQAASTSGSKSCSRLRRSFRAIIARWLEDIDIAFRSSSGRSFVIGHLHRIVTLPHRNGEPPVHKPVRFQHASASMRHAWWRRTGSSLLRGFR
jgi:hypothetical protein